MDDPMLPWPTEAARPDGAGFNWHQPGSNICLDFHGDPARAKLVVFSDGNHHMALEACCQQFLADQPDVEDIFYATTPPGVLVNALNQGGLQMGNLFLSVQPNVFISPKGIIDSLIEGGYMSSAEAFVRSRGNVLLVRKGNPKNIHGLADLLRDDVRLFISNPKTEKASFDVYSQTILAVGQQQELDAQALESKINTAIFGQRIHHRECPQAIYANQVDVAMIYYHLALRYCRIFPDDFELIPLTGTAEQPDFTDGNITTDYFIGVVGSGGNVGNAFVEFMKTNAALEHYHQHGLQGI